MELKSVIGKIISAVKGDGVDVSERSKVIRVFILLSCFVFLLLGIYIVGAILLVGSGSDSDVPAAAEFEGCSILKEECNDVDCGFYSYCADGEYESCRVYDCGNEYGFLRVNTDGSVSTKREVKPDEEAINTLADACKGETEFTGQECVGNGTQAKVRITPNGVCPIEGFTIFFSEEGAQPTTFTRLGSNIFLVETPRCGRISRIVPEAQGGLSLEDIVYMPKK